MCPGASIRRKSQINSTFTYSAFVYFIIVAYSDRFECNVSFWLLSIAPSGITGIAHPKAAHCVVKRFALCVRFGTDDSIITVLASITFRRATTDYSSSSPALFVTDCENLAVSIEYG